MLLADSFAFANERQATLLERNPQINFVRSSDKETQKKQPSQHEKEHIETKTTVVTRKLKNGGPADRIIGKIGVLLIVRSATSMKHPTTSPT